MDIEIYTGFQQSTKLSDVKVNCAIPVMDTGEMLSEKSKSFGLDWSLKLLHMFMREMYCSITSHHACTQFSEIIFRLTMS